MSDGHSPSARAAVDCDAAPTTDRSAPLLADAPVAPAARGGDPPTVEWAALAGAVRRVGTDTPAADPREVAVAAVVVPPVGEVRLAGARVGGGAVDCAHPHRRRIGVENGCQARFCHRGFGGARYTDAGTTGLARVLAAEVAPVPPAAAADAAGSGGSPGPLAGAAGGATAGDAGDRGGGHWAPAPAGRVWDEPWARRAAWGASESALLRPDGGAVADPRD